MTRCPKCDAPLRLVADTDDVTHRRDWVLSPRAFRILDVLGVTALIALQLAAFRAEVTPPVAEWPTALYLIPTALTCLIHIRFRLRIGAAVFVHYFATIVWTFLHSIGHNTALNAYNIAHPSPKRSAGNAIFSNALNDTLEMGFWAILLAFTYGAVSYTAIHANQLCDTKLTNARQETSG